MSTTKKELKIFPIGNVKSKNGEFAIEIMEEYRPGLKQLENFSHIHVLWWAHGVASKRWRKKLICVPPYGENTPETGVFATRAEYRPNPIAMTIVQILNVDMDNGLIVIPYIDAFDGTPVLDIKGYFPVCDRIRDSSIPPWLKGWPDWFEEAAEWAAQQGFEEE